MLSDIARPGRIRLFLRSASVLLLVMVGVGADCAASLPPGRAHPLSMRPARMVRDPQGFRKHGERDQQESDNWAGYLLASFQTGAKYTSIAGSWVVPGVTNEAAPFSDQNSATWVGIGGGCEDSDCAKSDDTLIQVGTEQDANSDGTTTYYPWYELLPDFAIMIPKPVQPGDAMTASVRCISSCELTTQTWTMAISDSTAGWNWTKTVSYASSEISAEWVEEAPTSDTNALDSLADYGVVTFVSLSVNGGTPALSLADDGIQMVDDSNSTTGNPSSPESNGSFSVCASVNSSFTPCPFFGTGSPLVAAILPASRSIGSTSTATVYATIVNGGATAGVNCSISSLTSTGLSFSYQATNPATNAVIGNPDTPVSIPAGGSQSFILSLTPVGGFSFGPTPVSFDYACDNLASVANLFDLNTLLLSSSTTPPSDVIALAATATGDGTLHIPGSSGIGAFAVAAANVGAGGSITAQATVTGEDDTPVSVSICETDPGTGQCLSSIAPTVTATINNGAEPTFSIFATASGTVPFSPAANRIFVQFTDSSGTVRGETSVAVTTN